MRLTVIPLNGGSAVFLDAPGSKNDLLIDCGDELSARFILMPFLRAQGVNRLQTMLLTHGDARQFGGAELVAANFPPKRVTTSAVRFRSAGYRKILDTLQSTPSRWAWLQRGDCLGHWTVLHPDSNDHFARADDAAVVLHGEISGTPVLLLSDLGWFGQKLLLERNADLRADIVVAGLPTEGEPLSDMLLEAIKPRLVVVADSEFPATRRASPQLRQRLAEHGFQVIYTREVGSVCLSLSKGGWKLRTMVQPQPTPAVNRLSRPDAS
jgi:competence protein ComEC